jgi:acetyltransferase-like isoleucine patch superfamily enzyme
MKIKPINLIRFVGVSWAKIYSFKRNSHINVIWDYMYSFWISAEFHCVGEKSLIKRMRCLIGGKYISIGNNCIIGFNAVITAWEKHGNDNFIPQIIIRNNVLIGDDSHITAINRIEIGNNVLTGKKVTITDNSHGKSTFEMLSLSPASRPLYSQGPVIIEDGVWIGDKVTILPNVRIGKNSIIGANAVVARDIPANCIAAGIPAKVIRIMS